jgi:hypothetical protein
MLAERTVSVSSPVAIRMTRTALPITSAGRFCPWGPLDMPQSDPFGFSLTPLIIDDLIAIRQAITAPAPFHQLKLYRLIHSVGEVGSIAFPHRPIGDLLMPTVGK